MTGVQTCALPICVAQYGAVKPAVALAELVGAAVYGVSYPAMVFPTSHDHWQGLLPPYVPFYREALADVDVLVAVGARVFHDFFKAATDVLPADAQLIQIDINQEEIARTEPVDRRASTIGKNNSCISASGC